MESLVEKQKISLLLDIYGGLLTGRQRDFLDLYYNEDLSYGEIADSENISRQAVHDTIQHAKKSLAKFEEYLGLGDKKQSEMNPVENGPVNSEESSIDVETLRATIAELSHLVNVDITYDMIPIQRQVKQLRILAGLENVTTESAK